MATTFIIRFKSKANKQADFQSMLETVKVELPAVKGCSSVVVLQNMEDKSLYTLVETWESRALHEAHLEVLKSTGAWDDVLSFLSDPPTSGYFNEL